MRVPVDAPSTLDTELEGRYLAISSVDHGPMNSTLWRGDLDLTITITYSARGSHKSLVADAVHRFVQANIRDDLDLHKYRTMLEGICLIVHGATGIVTFIQPHLIDMSHETYTSLPDTRRVQELESYNKIMTFEGKPERFVDSPARTLFDISSRLPHQIMEHVFGDKYGERIVDLDYVDGRLRDLHVYSVSKRWRRRLSHYFHSPVRYRFELASTTTPADFRSLSYLHRLLYTRLNESGKSNGDEKWEFAAWFGGTISLNFNLAKATTLRDVRYNITPLLIATRPAVGDWNIVITLRVLGATDERSVHTTTLAAIERTVMKVWPLTSLWLMERSPKIWVDGLNQLMTVEALTEETNNKSAPDRSGLVSGSNDIGGVTAI